MTNSSDLKKRVLSKYNLDPENPLKDGIFYFFGLCENGLNEAISQIRERDIVESLREDTRAWAEDFNKIHKKEVSKIDVEE